MIAIIIHCSGYLYINIASDSDYNVGDIYRSSSDASYSIQSALNALAYENFWNNSTEVAELLSDAVEKCSDIAWSDDTADYEILAIVYTDF